MQSLARSMLQELQLQGAPKAGEGAGIGGASRGRGGSPPAGGGSGGSGRRGGGSAAGSDGESETSFPFPSADISPATRSSPFFLEDSRAPGESSHGTPRGGGAQMEAESPVVRSGVGERSPPPRSRAPTLEAVVPQLLAKSSWIDVNVPLPTPDSVQKYRTAQRASTTAQILNLLSSNPAPTLPEISSPLQIITEAALPTELPVEVLASDGSKHSTSSYSTTASKASTASSFAYQIQHNLPDLRLLRQKSKPPQHTIQKPSILKIPGDIKRSPTFFKPKVVSDTAIVVMSKAGSHSLIPPTPPPHTFPETLRADSFIKTPLCRVQTLALPAIPFGKRLPQLSPASKEQRHAAIPHQATTSAKDFAAARSAASPDPMTRQLRFESPVATGWGNEDSPSPSVERSRKSSTSAQHTTHHHKRHYHSVTPPEDEPHVTPLHHGDSYFETFHILPEVTSKDFVPVQTPQAREHPKKADMVRRRPESEPVPPSITRPSIMSAHSKTSSETAVAATAKRGKQNSMFGFLRKPINGQFEQERSHDHVTPQESSTSTPITPALLLHPSDGVINKRRMSSVVPEMQMQSYFNRPRVRRLPSDNSLSPTGLATPLSNISDDPPSPYPGKGRSRYQNRSSSDQLSPLGTPRARHRPTLESLRSRVSQTTVRSTPASEANVRRVPTDKSDKKSSVKSAAKRNTKASVKFVDQPDSARTDPLALDRNQVALKSKPSNYFVDIRKVSSAEQLQLEGRPPSETKWTRRWSLVPKLSSMSLSRISLGQITTFATQKLRRKSSRLSSLTQDSTSGDTGLESESSPAPDPAIKGGIQPSIPLGRRFSAAQLEVTGFEQTPFSQRYHDSERALNQQIRALMDEAANEADDAEGDSELVLGFEQDVPDHFPTSPLCPLNPKHKSGGKAICPLHGRYKKGMPPPTLPAVKKPAGRVSSTGIDPHVGHHRIEIVLDTAIADEPPVKEGRKASVDIFGMMKEDHHVSNKVSVLGVDGAVSVRNRYRATSILSEQTDLGRGRRREKDLCGSERKRHRRTRMRWSEART